MEANAFTRDPIKIIVWTRPKTLGWTSSIAVAMGKTPKDVKTEVLAAYKTFKSGTDPKESKVLTHWYGKNWRQKLRLTLHADFAKGGDGEPQLESLEIDLAEFETIPKPSTVAAVEIVGESHIWLWDLTFFPEDKIIELKNRINKFLGIPMFRQHIWYIHQNYSIPMKYSVSATNFGPVNVDFYNQVIRTESKEMIADMPVQMYLYRIKDTIKVEAYDNFTILGDIYNQRGNTEYHLVDLETLVGPQRLQLAEILRKDRSQIHMLYYGFVVLYWPMMNSSVWDEYIDHRDIHVSYPQLDPTAELGFIPKQIKISNELYDLFEEEPVALRELERNIRKSLTHTTLKVSSTYRGKMVNFRALFDLLECDAVLDAVRFYDSHDGRSFIVDKYFWQSEASAEKMLPGVLYIRMVINHKPYQKLDIFLYPNASYAISGSWGEDMAFGFADINQLVNVHVMPLIKQLNKLAEKIMYFDGMQFPILDKTNVKYVDIGISIFWKQALTNEEFKGVKSLLDMFTAARIMQEKSIDHNVFSYYFKKGMYEFDAKRIEKLQVVDNYYSYLFNADMRQKWFLLFENIRVMIVSHRYSDIKIEISGIKEDEYYVFQRYILLLLWMASHLKRARSVVPDKLTKPLNNLKEQDPHLYNFKRIYNSTLVYSKICQKPYQPLLMSQKQYEDIKDKSVRESVVKFWNFTSQAPAYYQCPNPKFPHIRFITDKHPMGYCIPCCKITAVPTAKDDKQKRRHDECLKEGKYTRTIIENSGSRYVMSYGKPIDVGRLSSLPDSTLEPLFADTKVEESSENVLESRYYLYGVVQNHPRIVDVGYIYCLANSLALSVPELCTQVAARVRQHKEFFKLLVNGRAARWWPTAIEMATDIVHSFNGGASIANVPVDWNELFVDLARVYLGVQTIIFEDLNTVIQLRIPESIVTLEDYSYPSHKHLIVLHNVGSNYWNPIYIINKYVYFRTNIIDTRLFDFTSEIIILITDMVKTRFVKKVQSEYLTLSVLRKYLEHRKMAVTKVHLTHDNMIYGVQVGDLGFIPVHLSYFKFDADIALGFASAEIVPPKINDIMNFTTAWNAWVAKRSQESGFTLLDVPLDRPILERIEPMYPIVKVESWFAMPDGRVGGFYSCGMNWYMQPAPAKLATEYSKATIRKLNYSPIDINRRLEKYANAKPVEDKRSETINQVLYEKYLYRLLMLQFIKLFNRQKNLKIRTEIKILFAKSDFRSNLMDIQVHISTLVGGNKLDVDKIFSKIDDFTASTGDKKKLLAAFDADYYNFDRNDKLKTLPKDQLKLQLHKLIEPMIQIGVPTITDFPNILGFCTDSIDFCRGQKLIIGKQKLDEYINILADQIKNPFVEKYLFSPLFASRIIDYFKFMKRETEIIEIQFL